MPHIDRNALFALTDKVSLDKEASRKNIFKLLAMHFEWLTNRKIPEDEIEKLYQDRRCD